MSKAEYEGGLVRAYVGYSFRAEETAAEPSVESAITDAVAKAGLKRGENESWFEVSRIQAQVVEHNQWVRGFRVTITPSE
jgi:flavin-binding protein dodecin